MTRDQIKDFTLRITEANSCSLIVILYDMINTDIENAREALAKGDHSVFRNELAHACKCVNELMRSLDYSTSMSRDLGSLYTYLNRRLSYAAAGNHADALDIVTEVVNKLRKGFDEISATDPNGPMMKNAQSVYAGLTYGKGFLNETYIDPRDYNRGFNA